MTYGLTLAATAKPVVWIVLSAAEGPYATVAGQVRAEVERRRPRGAGVIDWQVGAWNDMDRSRPPSLVVAVGASAWRDVAQGFGDAADPPLLLATLLPAQAFERDRPRGPRLRQISAILLDQPAARQARLVHMLLPQTTRVGVLVSRGESESLAEYRETFARQGLVLNVQPTTAESLPADLIGVLSTNDVLLVLPDGQVYNAQTIGNVLAASYRLRVPIIGYSPALVSAGALAALYVTPEQIGVAAGAAVADALDGRPLPPPRAAATFDVGVNASVARAYGVVTNAREVAAAMTQAERGDAR